jgi:hypothetical protein
VGHSASASPFLAEMIRALEVLIGKMPRKNQVKRRVHGGPRGRGDGVGAKVTCFGSSL